MRTLLLVIVVSLPARMALACTTFLMSEDGKHFVGKSYDYKIGDGHVVHNKRGVGKRALPLEPGSPPAEWVSKYASLTFNQYGREMPNGGMNEAGLVVEIMWLNESRAPPADDRPALNELQWIQYQLDRFATAAEVIENAPALRVAPVYGKVHYLVCDRTSACAAVEYLGGELTITAGDDLVAKTLTNHTYRASRAELARHQGFGGSRSVPTSRGSLARFVRATAMATGARKHQGVNGVFEILDAVRAGSYTRWQIAYDLDRLVVHFRTSTRATIKTVALADFEASCNTPVVVVDIDTPAAGDARARFHSYRREHNAALLERSLAHVRSALPPGAAESLAVYPEMLPCTLAPP